MNKITYHKEGDYLIPDLSVKGTHSDYHIGLYGRLRLEYLKCSVLFLPLKRYTANNSLLEASSTGCNIVISSNYPDNSYIPDKYVTLTKMDVTCTTNTILKSHNYDYNEALSEFIKIHYGWELIASKTYETLQNV